MFNDTIIDLPEWRLFMGREKQLANLGLAQVERLGLGQAAESAG